jgi:Ca2+/H+ antiporter, TMEM165/GDT1 family
LLSPSHTTAAALQLLFLYFGVKMLKEGFEASGGGPSDELAEVEMELLQSKRESEDDIAESGSGSGPAASHHHNGNSSSKAGSAVAAGAHKDAWAVFTQGFTLTFLAEWGDRSQIATIALAAAKNVVGVTVGGILGHSMCTGLAVVGGRLLAARISEKTVHLVGGALFLVFGLHSLVFGL